jgi:CMP-N-acetylneuraminic acid synthetase
MAQRVLGLIPARAGSKGIPGKNLKLLAGKPLILHTVDCALACPELDDIVVSTDSRAIIDLVTTRLGVRAITRPGEYAQDDTPMFEVVRHVVEYLSNTASNIDRIILLQPTSPLRKPEHIRHALAMLRFMSCDSVVSVVPLPETHSPDYVMRVETDGRIVPFLSNTPCLFRRQDVRQAYARDGTIYAFWRKTLQGGDLYGARCLPLILDRAESITLDTIEEWIEAERRLSQRDAAVDGVLDHE